ncbi:MAG: hypothetical protein OXN93_02415 [bacterium]|nr:hypothetical protein [bacterium]
MRDDSFMPVEDQAIDMFSSIAGDAALRDDGTCNHNMNPDDVLGGDFADGDCIWHDNDDATDVNGNLITSEDVAPGTTRTFYAWIGSKDGDVFDADKFTAQTASSQARYAQDDLRITDTINTHAEPTAEGDKVNLNSTRTVTFTVQLRNMSSGTNVARAGVQFRVEYRQGPETATDARNQRSYVNTHEDLLTTDEDGKVTFTITGPTPNSASGQSRDDDVVFTELDATGAATARTAEGAVSWSEEVIVLRKTTLETPTYVVAGNPSVGAIVRLWDQYGNPHRSRSGQTADITIDGTEETGRNVISRGYARWARGLTNKTAGAVVVVSYDNVIAYSRDANGYLLDTNDDQIDGDGDAANGVQPTTNVLDSTGTLRTTIVAVYDDSTPAAGTDPVTVPRGGPNNVQVVQPANSTQNSAYIVTHVMADDNKYLADINGEGDGVADVVFTYDSDDTFIDSSGGEGVPISMERFEALIDNATGVANTATTSDNVMVQAVVYNADGTSVFTITAINTS